jgi:hypothetical protein
MRSGRSLLFAAVLLSSGLACKDSNTMAGPAVAPGAASLAGTWTGTYSSKAPSCPATPVTIDLTQDGASVTGSVTTNACGPHGFFKATVSGNSLTGNIDLGGCTGGGVLGEIHGNVLSLSIADFYQPLVTEDKVVIVGGAVTLNR